MRGEGNRMKGGEKKKVKHEKDDAQKSWFQEMKGEGKQIECKSFSPSDQLCVFYSYICEFNKVLR